MNQKATDAARTRALLLQHINTYPNARTQDVFKYLFHSAFGCDHLVSDEQSALQYILGEYAKAGDAPDLIEPLDGRYSRVHLGVLKNGLHPRTLAKIFVLSAKREANGMANLAQKLEVAQEMLRDGTLPLDGTHFAQQLDAWRAAGCPALHHSSAFRQAYHPAYRVIANQYVAILPLLTEIDKRLADGSTVVALEGGSASGKSTLADTLLQIYGSSTCNLFHTDDFFLQPAQRTPERLAEVGGNLDRERLMDDVLRSVCMQETVRYRQFDCASQTLGNTVTVPHKQLTVIEGAYSMHPAFGQYYHLAVFLDIDPATQKERVTKRNAPALAKRFFEEWIPLENAYFTGMDVKSRAHLILRVQS